MLCSTRREWTNASPPLLYSTCTVFSGQHFDFLWLALFDWVINIFACFRRKSCRAKQHCVHWNSILGFLTHNVSHPITIQQLKSVDCKDCQNINCNQSVQTKSPIKLTRYTTFVFRPTSQQLKLWRYLVQHTDKQVYTTVISILHTFHATIVHNATIYMLQCMLSTLKKNIYIYIVNKAVSVSIYLERKGRRLYLPRRGGHQKAEYII